MGRRERTDAHSGPWLPPHLLISDTLHVRSHLQSLAKAFPPGYGIGWLNLCFIVHFWGGQRNILLVILGVGTEQESFTQLCMHLFGRDKSGWRCHGLTSITHAGMSAGDSTVGTVKCKFHTQIMATPFPVERSS